MPCQDVHTLLKLALLLILFQSITHADTLTGRVVRVTDGDTLVVLIDGLVSETHWSSSALIPDTIVDVQF